MAPRMAMGTLNRRRFIQGALAAPLVACSRGPADSLRRELAALEKRGRLGVAFLDTAKGAVEGHRLDERFAMCSVFKLPLAAMILHAADEGKVRLDARVRFGSADLVAHAPITSLHLAEGAMSLRELARAAQTASDNAAANLLLREVGGPAALTRFCRSMGDAMTRLDRMEPMMNDSAPGDERDTTTPRAMARLVAKLLDGGALKKPSRDLLLGWMVETKTGSQRLRSGLSPAFRAGDKTGTYVGAKQTAKYNDVAYAWQSRRSAVVLAAFYDSGVRTEHVRSEDEAVLAEVGRLAGKWTERS